MDVIYCWSKGASFAEVIQMTDIFEGSIVRSARRLDEFLNQVDLHLILLTVLPCPFLISRGYQRICGVL
uniref:ATP-dependent RNA helicase Ski2/MTR4 C-terminal domain-containing protein n=1 Tax=Rhizophora mucronata TaxID=61149 RepID=A0A2P2MK78_RHIMU